MKSLKGGSSPSPEGRKRYLDDPLVVIGMPRSGTSLCTGLIAKHGFWCGEHMGPTDHNPHGSFENMAIKEWLREHHEWTPWERIGPVEGFRDFLETVVPPGPWVFKHTPFLVDIWEGATFVCVRRDYNSTVRSILETNFMQRFHKLTEEWLEICDEAHHIMDEVGDFNIYPDDIVNGDLSSLRNVLESRGVELNPEVAEAFIVPDAWKH